MYSSISIVYSLYLSDSFVTDQPSSPVSQVNTKGSLVRPSASISRQRHRRPAGLHSVFSLFIVLPGATALDLV